MPDIQQFIEEHPAAAIGGVVVLGLTAFALLGNKGSVIPATPTTVDNGAGTTQVDTTYVDNALAALRQQIQDQFAAQQQWFYQQQYGYAPGSGGQPPNPNPLIQPVPHPFPGPGPVIDPGGGQPPHPRPGRGERLLAARDSFRLN